MSTINELRQQVHKLVDTASDTELEFVYRILEVNGSPDWWDAISTEQQQAINKGIEQLDNGQGIAHEEVYKKYEQWLTK